MKPNFHHLQNLLQTVKVAKVTVTMDLERRNTNGEEEIEVCLGEILEEDNTEEDSIIVPLYQNQEQDITTILVIQTPPDPDQDQDQQETDLNIIIIQGPVQGPVQEIENTSQRRSTGMMRRSFHPRQSITER